MVQNKLQEIKEEYLQSFKKVKSQVQEPDRRAEGWEKGKKEMQELKLTRRENVEIVFNQLEHSRQLAKVLESNQVLDDYSWNDLYLINGNTKTPSEHMLQKVKRTITTTGDCVMATELVKPTADASVLEEKVAITKCLLEEKATAEALRECLQVVKKEEEKRNTLWHPNTPLKHETYENNLENSFYAMSVAQRGKKGFALWRPNKKSPGKLLFLKLFKDFFFFVFYPFLIIGMPFYRGGVTLRKLLLALARKPETILFFIIMLPLIFINAFLYYRRNKRVITFLAQQLSSLRTFLAEAKKINRIVKGCPALEKVYGKHLVKTRKLLADARKDSEKGKMTRYLQALPGGSWSFFLSHTGKLLAAYALFQEHKNAYSEAIYELGKLDVRLSSATLLEESETKGLTNRYVLPSYKETTSSTLPSLEGKGVWHPGLCPSKAVSNDMVMAAEGGTRTMIITGPNTAGKSTYILSGAINVVLSQCGFPVAARSFRHHIFSKILTYVNPVQNLGQGLSLADAGMEVLKKHKIVFQTTRGPIFAVLDEILNGVDPSFAVEYAKEILQKRHTNYPNCLTVLTTHYQELTKLEEMEGFTNKKVEVIAPGKYNPFDCTYKIKDGVADQNIVRELLEHKGILERVI